MPKGELIINGHDAFEQWGISFTSSSLSALMTPAPKKAFISNKSRNSDGKRVVAVNPRQDERQLTLEFNLTAHDEHEFFNRYEQFCHQLDTGMLFISTKYQPGVVYKTEYESCTQFTQFVRQMARFSLKLTEPNPKDRNA